jgi:exodeoxyribonuclease VII small subunit
MSDAPTYETATARLDEIIRRLDSGEAGLRETLDLCQEGRTLVEFCAGELEAVGQGLQELRLDQLVARLEQGAAGASASAAGANAAGANAAGAPVPGEAAGR